MSEEKNSQLVENILYMGIDEAGKGSVIGPLVLGTVIWTSEQEEFFKKVNINDSKTYTSKVQKDQRSKLSELIRKNSLKAFITEISAKNIDKAVLANKMVKRSNINLNILEIGRIASTLISHPCSTIYIDSLGSPSYFYKELERFMKKNHSERFLSIEYSKNNENLVIKWKISNKYPIKTSTIVAENKADSIYKIVSAASIIAKVYRDKRIRDLEEENSLPEGILASGYPNNQLLPFINRYEKKIKNKSFDFIRYQWAWDPLQRLFKNKKKSLSNFL